MSSVPPIVPMGAALEWDDTACREEHQRRFGEDVLYDDFDPAYRHGDSGARDPAYAGLGWAEAEPRMRADWESRHPESSWERFKDAVRYAWDRGRS